MLSVYKLESIFNLTTHLFLSNCQDSAESDKVLVRFQGHIGMCIFMVLCFSEKLSNKVTEILIFSHFWGTNIATFTEKSQPNFKFKAINCGRAFGTSLLYPKFLFFLKKTLRYVSGKLCPSKIF